MIHRVKCFVSIETKRKREAMYSSTPFPTKGYLTSMIKLSMAMALILPFLSPKICFSYT